MDHSDTAPRQLSDAQPGAQQQAGGAAPQHQQQHPPNLPGPVLAALQASATGRTLLQRPDLLQRVPHHMMSNMALLTQHLAWTDAKAVLGQEPPHDAGAPAVQAATGAAPAIAAPRLGHIPPQPGAAHAHGASTTAPCSARPCALSCSPRWRATRRRASAC